MLLLVYIAGIELISTVTINNRGWTTDRDSYPDRKEEIKEALAYIRDREDEKNIRPNNIQRLKNIFL